jgi:hypothetical protein
LWLVALWLLWTAGRGLIRALRTPGKGKSHAN